MLKENEEEVARWERISNRNLQREATKETIVMKS